MGQQQVSGARESDRPMEEPSDGGDRQHRGRPEGSPAVCVSQRTGRGADEPDQRHRRVPHGTLEARVVPAGDSRGRGVGDRKPRLLRFSGPPIVPVRRRSEVPGDRPDLRPGGAVAGPGEAGYAGGIRERERQTNPTAQARESASCPSRPSISPKLTAGSPSSSTTRPGTLSRSQTGRPTKRSR